MRSRITQSVVFCVLFLGLVLSLWRWTAAGGELVGEWELETGFAGRTKVMTLDFGWDGWARLISRGREVEKFQWKLRGTQLELRTASFYLRSTPKSLAGWMRWAQDRLKSFRYGNDDYLWVGCTPPGTKYQIQSVDGRTIEVRSIWSGTADVFLRNQFTLTRPGHGIGKTSDSKE
ncbi:hypothetical protein [Planctomicrobium piriforme]|uniref:Uncharacterized protein n=1 Tax=Planctomicrobium piriforme TaxID=1576369 RepID=A0A1I3D5V1_9PLAN|nr:hypothetical protein [Planctomicrobium piriforme]SFH82092.1 hypothetical protein SAMN05421753_103104 [Planctomicrobium piriforme]